MAGRWEVICPCMWWMGVVFPRCCALDEAGARRRCWAWDGLRAPREEARTAPDRVKFGRCGRRACVRRARRAWNPRSETCHVAASVEFEMIVDTILNTTRTLVQNTDTVSAGDRSRNQDHWSAPLDPVRVPYVPI